MATAAASSSEPTTMAPKIHACRHAALARPHLYDPYFTLHAAAEQEYMDQQWPPQYQPAKPPKREKLRWFEREKQKKRKRVL